MKENTPTLAMLAALTLILATLITLSLSGQKPESPILLGLVSAASGMAGAIGGFSMNSSGRQPSITNSPGAQVGDTKEGPPA
jgi:hypothetical protein